MRYSSKLAALVWLYPGIFLVVLAASTLRYLWLVSNHIDTNMPPSAAVLTSPFVAAELWIGAIIIELAVRIFDRRPRPPWQYAFIGASYCSVMVFSVSILAGILAVVAVNPLTMRVCLSMCRQEA